MGCNRSLLSAENIGFPCLRSYGLFMHVFMSSHLDRNCGRGRGRRGEGEGESRVGLSTTEAVIFRGGDDVIDSGGGGNVCSNDSNDDIND